MRPHQGGRIHRSKGWVGLAQFPLLRIEAQEVRMSKQNAMHTIHYTFARSLGCFNSYIWIWTFIPRQKYGGYEGRCCCAIYLVSWDEGFLPEVFNIPLVLLTVYFFLRRMHY